MASTSDNNTNLSTQVAAPTQGANPNVVSYDTGRDNPNTTLLSPNSQTTFQSDITEPIQAQQGSGFGQQFASINQLIQQNQGANPYSGAQNQTNQYGNTLNQDQTNVNNQAQAIGQTQQQFSGAGQFVQNVIANPSAFVYNPDGSTNQANVNQFSQYYNGTQPTFNDLTAAQNQAQTDYNNFQSFGQLAGSESGMQQINSQSAGPNQYSQGMNNLDTLLQNSNPQSLNSFQGQINQNLQNYNQQLQNQNSGIQSQMSNLQNTVQNTAQQTQQAVAQGLTAQQTAQQQALSQLQGQDTTLQQNLAGGVYSNPNGNTNGLSAAQAQALLGINANQFNQLQQLSVAPTQTYTDQFGNVQTVQGNVQVTPQSAFLGQNNLNQSNYMTSQMANQVNALDLLAGQTAQYSNPNQFTGANLGTVDTSQFANDLTAQQSNLQQNVAASQAAQQQAYQNLINQYSNQNTFNKTFGAGAYFNNGSTPDWATQGAQQEQALVSSKIGSNQSFASQFGTDAAKQAALQQIAQNLMKYSVAPPTGGASDGGGDGGAGE